jgi:hypothetical protein
MRDDGIKSFVECVNRDSYAQLIIGVTLGEEASALIVSPSPQG